MSKPAAESYCFAKPQDDNLVKGALKTLPRACFENKKIGILYHLNDTMSLLFSAVVDIHPAVNQQVRFVLGDSAWDELKN